MSSLATDLIPASVVIAAIVRELKGPTIAARPLLLLPAAAIGIIQGYAMGLERRNGALWGQLPPWGHPSVCITADQVVGGLPGG